MWSRDTAVSALCEILARRCLFDMLSARDVLQDRRPYYCEPACLPVELRVSGVKFERGYAGMR